MGAKIFLISGHHSLFSIHGRMVHRFPLCSRAFLGGVCSQLMRTIIFFLPRRGCSVLPSPARTPRMLHYDSVVLVVAPGLWLGLPAVHLDKPKGRIAHLCNFSLRPELGPEKNKQENALTHFHGTVPGLSRDCPGIFLRFPKQI